MADMDFVNAREPEQVRRMQELAQAGECHFCRKGFETRHTAPIIHENGNWLIAANNFPYKGSVHHYLIVPTIGHPTEIEQLGLEAWSELQEAVVWLRKHLKAPGGSLFVRSGDMSYTGATLDHMHFHFLVGGKRPENPQIFEDNILVTLGYKQK